MSETHIQHTNQNPIRADEYVEKVFRTTSDLALAARAVFLDILHHTFDTPEGQEHRRNFENLKKSNGKV